MRREMSTALVVYRPFTLWPWDIVFCLLVAMHHPIRYSAVDL